MADAKKFEIENALQKQVHEIEKRYLRKLQKVMFECSAKCCTNENASTQEVGTCVDKCNIHLGESHNYISSQINSYQNRLQRCVSQCNDEAKDMMGAVPTEIEVEKASKSFEICACTCIDKHIDILPQFMAKIHEVMSKKVESVTGQNLKNTTESL